MQQIELSFAPPPSRTQDSHEWLRVGARDVRLMLVPNRRARRYVLRLRADGVARVTIPRGGSAAEAKKFVQRNTAWLEKQFWRRAVAPPLSRAWLAGTEILFRGQRVRLETGVNGETGVVRFGGQQLSVRDPAADLRPEVEAHLRKLAAGELPARAFALAELHRLPVRRVSVRNQKSRWGSCSRRGTISLNWRLIQAPDFVQDYLILHELAHLKEMNHSPRFWGEVERICQDYRNAESWLKQHARILS